MKNKILTLKYFETLNECTDLLENLHIYLDKNYVEFIKTPNKEKHKELERIKNLLIKSYKEILKRKELQIK